MRRIQNLFGGASLILSLATVMFVTANLRAQAQVKAEQLTGDWVHVGAADMKALSFSKDGKVAIYFGGGSEAMTSEFAVLGDGRLDISEQGIVHNFFLPTLTGDQLQLKDPQSGKVAQYRRLKAGETMVAAIATQDKAMQQAVQVRNGSVPAFLMRQDLVLVSTAERANAPEQRGILGEDIRPTTPTPAALQFIPNGNDFGGRVFFDTKPPRLDAVGAQIQNPQSDTPTVAIWFGPGTAGQNRGTLFFHPAGTAPNITLTYSVTTNGSPVMIIKADPTMHAQILERFKTEATRLNALKTPVLAMLKDYVVLKGTSQSAMPAERQGFTDQFILSRNPQNSSWMGQGQVVNVATGATDIFPVVAGVGIVKEKPAIQIMSQKRVYLFTDIDASGGKLTGVWQMPNNPSAHSAQLTVAQATDAKAAQQLFATRKAALQKLGSGTIFHGVFNEANNDRQPPNPVAVTFTSTAAGAVTGKAVYALEGCTMTFSGREVDTPLGPQLQIRYTAGQADQGALGDVQGFINSVQHEIWLLSPTEASSGGLRLSGYAITNPTPGAVPISIQLIPYADADKTAITQALSSGMQFKVTAREIQGPDDIVEFTKDPATGKITGRVMAGGSHMGLAVGITFAGDIIDHSDWAQLTMPIHRSPTDQRTVYAYTVVATSTDAGMYLSACMYNISQGPTRPFGRWDAFEVKK